MTNHSTHRSRPTPTAPRWADQPTLLLDLAINDLEQGIGILPSLIAFRGEEALVLATLRSFDKGSHHDPIIEVATLAAVLGADRLVVSLGGRAWSMDDPIPPVLPDGPDLRQPVVVIHQVDASVDPPLISSTIQPYDLAEIADDLAVLRGTPVTVADGTGWVPRVLLTVATACQGPHDDTDLLTLASRCERLGHRLAWSPSVGARLQSIRDRG